MKTVYDAKMALDYDTMINVVKEYRSQNQKPIQKPKRRRNKWVELFPVCKNK